MSETTEPKIEGTAPAITIDAPQAETAAAATQPSLWSRLAFKPKLSRVSILSLAIVASAASGSVIGAIAGAAIIRSGDADVPTATATLTKGTLSLLSADIAALKASIEAGDKAAKARAAQLAERIERAEKAASDPAKFAKLNESLDRLEKKSAAASSDITGSIAKDQMRPPVVAGWTLRDVFDGRAMIESRDGLFEVGPGSNIPGLGRIEAIRRVDGRWVVSTPRGIIVSSR